MMLAMMFASIGLVKAAEPLTVALTGAMENSVNFTLNKGETTSVTFVNQSSETLNVAFQETHSITGTLSTPPKADQDLIYSRDLAPNATFVINYAYGRPTGEGSTDMTLAYTATIVKQYQTSQNASAPKVISESGTYEGGGNGGFDYFTIALKQPSFVKATIEGDGKMDRMSNVQALEISLDGKTIDTRAKAGSYGLMIRKAGSLFSTSNATKKEYRLNLTITPINYGTPVLVNPTMESTKTSAVTVKLVGADPVVTLQSIGIEAASGQQASVKLFKSEATAGKKAIHVIYGDDQAGLMEADLSLTILPGQPSLSLKNFKATYNSISYMGSFLHGNRYEIQYKQKGKWKKAKNLLKRAEYHVHISDMGADECPLTDSEYKTEQPSGCFHLPSQQSSCCSRTEASSSIS